MESRKKDHIDLALRSQFSKELLNKRFYYEPALSAHPTEELQAQNFLNKKLRLPIWVSSMTGGTAKAKHINTNLAKVCREYGMGMGLGSCRPLLEDDSRLSDFNMRSIIGDDLPLVANLGIAQIEELLEKDEIEKLQQMVKLLDADGLFVHLNPIQEYLQPEGDRFRLLPIEIMERLLEKVDFPVLVKEVGQGMGPKSIEALMDLDLAGIEFGAFGGTNFAQMELYRSDELKQEILNPLSTVGHTAEEMVDYLNGLPYSIMHEKNIIISGGISNWLEGYYLIEKIKYPAVFGQASAFLKYAQGDYKQLSDYVLNLKKGLLLANSYLTIRQ
ncbi:MAG: type 2 isopentenyl-diphosphate Delta-isomerase [Bacteroidetes bacterium]|nr:MAG: type 2 isopentenyl-diphosphate Delta-isomerase [Bacteroidota bacterium]